MPAIRSFMLSFLSVRLALQGAKFSTQHPGSWLVWEPGQWRAPAGDARAQTIAGVPLALTPMPGDALCFQLSSGGDRKELRLGRDGAHNDVVLNDATVSREHALLLKTGPDDWSVAPVNDRQVRVDGRLVEPGKSVPLQRAAGVVLGSVRLTWYDPAGFQERLREATAGKRA